MTEKSKNPLEISIFEYDDLADSRQFDLNDSGTCEKIDTRLTQACSPTVPSWTYFVQRADGRIKIGFSERPDRRIRGLSRAFGDLDILAVAPSSIAGEFETHERFEACRVEGEWFEPAPVLLAFIESVKGHEPTTYKPARKRKPVRIPPKVDPLIGKLHILRSTHKGDSPIGHRCSNLAQMIPVYRASTDPEQRKRLAAGIKQTSNELQNLTASF